MSAKLNLTYSNVRDKYCDGDVEKDILNIFKSDNPKEKINTILGNNPSWPMRYHLSPVRENLLNWYDFDNSKSLLEIGAGCGALTGIFCDSVKSVTAVELTRQRSEIIYHRHKNRNNLDIIAGNFNDIQFKNTYDYITLIGVLEYAGKFTHTKDPFKSFLLNIKKLLKEDGELIIAIENKFGLKYWAGCREDHTGKYFDSIEGYPDDEGIQTFGREEVIELLSVVGFKDISFYYPMPDYKMPVEVFSDMYLPTEKHMFMHGIFPTNDYSQSRVYLFDEKRVMKEVIKNKNFPFFANSFIIIAKI